jgi:predicted metalloprotease with PDZ domain
MTFMTPTLRYTVAMPQPTNHYFEVTGEIGAGVGEPIELVMPVWTPGSYMVREYSRHLQRLTAQDAAGQSLTCQKTSKNHWRIENPTGDRITFHYRLYANDLTVRTNHLDSTHGYFNGAATFLYLPGRLQEPIDVTIELPSPTWKIATALPQIGEHTYRAKDFDTLVDSPFEIGLHTKLEFEVLGKPHEFVIWGKGNVDPEALVADTRKIIETEAKLFGGLPYDRYLFILHLSNGYGGLEHKDSTTLLFSRNGFKKRESYEDFLTLVAHEFFHLWNVKRIRPKALEVFDYENENYTPSLWFSEGATSFYDNVIPVRSGIYDGKTYLKNFSKSVTRYLTTIGRTVQPLSESSFDAWIKLYRPDANSSNSQMSYYLKGEMVTFLLDLSIRKRHDNGRSMDDVMQALWENFGKAEIGFTPEDLKATIEQVAGFDLTEFFTHYLHGLEDLPFQAILADFGLRLESNLEGGKLPPYLGMRTAQEQGRTMVKSVANGSPAELAGLDAGDELVAIDGLRVTGDLLTDRLQQSHPNEVLEFTYFHQDELLQTFVKLAEPEATKFTIVPVPDPTPQQQNLFEGWLGMPLTQLVS